MSKRAPSLVQLLVIAAFALSCFGILLFLWVTFGGPTPFKARTYEINVPFKEATQLAQQSDVRISGVSVGKVKEIVLAPNGKDALAKVDIEDKYAPIPKATRAILRTKTLLGETYIELTPADRDGPKLHDGGTLPAANIAESVQLDEIFSAFDADTRAAFQSWMQEASVAIAGNAQGLSNAFGEFEPTFTEFDRLFRVLDTQRLAVRRLFRDGATTFEALRGRQGELAGLIRNSNTVFSTTARRDRDIEALFRAFPTFEDESRLTLERLKSFALNADPLMRQLVPAAEQLSPTLIAFSKLAPQAKGFFEGFAPVIAQAPVAFPALRKFFRDDFPPILRAVDPFLRNLNPILTGLDLYKHEVTALFANVAATANTVALSPSESGEQVHFLRTLAMLGPESAAAYPNRLTTNRNSAYSQPLASKNLGSGLLNFDTRQCSSGITATLDSETPKNATFQDRFQNLKNSPETEATDFFNRLKKYAFAGQINSGSVPAPGCAQQPPFDPIGKPGAATSYQHTFEQQGK